MSSQEAFLTRVRRALRKESVPAAVRPPLLATADCRQEARVSLLARLIYQRADLVERLQRELTAVGGVVAHVASVVDATQYIVQFVQDRKVSRIVRWPSPFLRTLELEAMLQAAGRSVEVTEAGTDIAADPADSAALAVRRQALRAQLAQADVGLSGVDYVIAETGTLVLAAHPEQMRGVSLLPPVHVAVARTEQIVATLADVLLLLQTEGTDVQQHLSSCVSFITGPSRTGDIELTLTVGVHGPGELHLVLID
jgi:L-lactate dehydrogenase complex protein LldG